MQAFREDRSPDGGLYFPEKLPRLTRKEIEELGCQPENAAIAALLNRFGDWNVTGWDLDFSVGRRWVRLTPLERKAKLCQCWYAAEGRVDSLTEYLSGRFQIPWGFWGKTAVRIAVLGMGLSRSLAEDGESPAVDLAMVGGDFAGVLAGLCLKAMGFPVGKLIVCCNENNSAWELVHLGALHTDGVTVKTMTPEADLWLPLGLEGVLSFIGGPSAAVEYAKCAYLGGEFLPGEELLRALRSLLYVSVVSDSRMAFTLSGVLKNTGRLLSPYEALAYAGVQDYRAKGGENRLCVLLSEKSPQLDEEILARALKKSLPEVRAILRR